MQKYLLLLASLISFVSPAQTPGAAGSPGLTSAAVSASDLPGLLAPHPATTAGQAYTQLPDGRWLLSGGSGSGGASAAAVIVDSAGHPSPAGHMLQTRGGHSATLLPSGKVLILGGVDAHGNLVATAEQFDPTSASFSAADNFGLTPRVGHSVNVLGDGRLLIAGGADVHGQAVQEVDIVDPRCASCSPQRINTGRGAVAFASTDTVGALLPNLQVLFWNLPGGTPQAATGGGLIDSAQQNVSAASAAGAWQAAQSLNGIGKPVMQSSLPAADAGAAAVDQPLIVRFGQRMQVASLNTATITLFGPSGPVTIAPVPVEYGLLLFVNLKQSLLPGARYTLFIDGATDVNGQALPFTAIGFTTTSLNAQGNPVGVTMVTSGATAPNTTTTVKPGGTNTSTTSGPNSANNTGAPNTPGVTTDTDEAWQPHDANYHGLWTSGRADLAKQHQPRRAELQRAYLRTELQRDGRIRPKQREAMLPAIRRAAAPDGVTALVGQTLKLNGQPLAGVTVSMGERSAISDDNGEFLLSDIPSGAPPNLSPMLQIDGRSASNGATQYGRYFYRIHIKAGQVNTLQQPVWMVKLDTAHAVNIASPVAQDTVITNPQLPGLEVHLPPGAVVRDADGKIVTQVSLTPVPADQLPFPMPYGQLPVYYTLQPGGATIESATGKPLGARVVYPNYSTQPPGARFEQFDYDPKGRGWYVYGTAKVSPDGKHLISDKDFVLYQFSASSVASSGGGDSDVDPNCKKDPKAGDPIGCRSGLYTENIVDLAIDDIVPIGVSRAYRANEPNQHSFGVGGSDDYDAYLYFADASLEGYGYTVGEIDMIEGDGGKTRFIATTDNHHYLDPSVIYQSTTPGRFYMAQLRIINPGGAGDAYGSPFTITLRNGTVYTFSYYQAQLQSIQDRWGNTVGIARDSLGRKIAVSSPNGRSIRFEYNAPGCSSCITAAIDSIGRQVSYAYDNHGYLTQITDVMGGITTITYDPVSGNLQTLRDPRNNANQIAQPTITNTYYGLTDGTNLNARVKQQTAADGSTIQFTYSFDSIGNATQTIVTDALGNQTLLQYTADGHVAQQTSAYGQPEQQTTSDTWDPVTGLLQSTTDALGRTTSYTYDAAGNVLSVTLLAGTANAQTTHYTYNSNFNVLTSATDLLQHTVNLSYNNLGSLTQVQDANGNVVHLAVSTNGQVSSVTNALGKNTSFNYDQSSLVKATDALNHSINIAPDAAGRPTQITDSLGHNALLQFDNFDRVTQTTDPLGKTTQVSYDPNSNLTQVKDANSHVHGFSFDTLDYPTGYTDPLGKSDNYQYDANHNLIRATDRKGQVTQFAYDHLGRTVSITYADGSTKTFGYDAGNRVTSVVDSTNGSVSYTYDNLNNATSITSTSGGTTPSTSSVAYTYYANGLRQSMTVSGQPTVSYTYDAGDRLTQITQAAGAANGNIAQTIRYSYDAANHRTQTVLANGIAMQYAYDDVGQLSGITYS